MEIIKKIIREELSKVLSDLKENQFFKRADWEGITTKAAPEDDIIYDFEKGREFAINNLQSDIGNLNTYHLADYLPTSINNEKWSFEFETTYGTILIVDVIRKIRGNQSFWSLVFGQLYKDSKEPVIIDDSIQNIPGYNEFVKAVNSKLASKIDTSKY